MLKKILTLTLLVAGYYLTAGQAGLLVNLTFAQQDESLTITTYYPSPYGAYNKLQTYSFGVGDNNGDGRLDSADVPTNRGDVWVAGNVGIGTTSPQSSQDGRTIQLDVAENIVAKDVYLDNPKSGNPRWASEALRTYDSGWFAISAGGMYVRAHGLGTTKVIAQLWLSDSSSGSNAWLAGLFDPTFGGYHRWVDLRNLTTTTISALAGGSGWYYPTATSINCCRTSGYARIIIVALE